MNNYLIVFYGGAGGSFLAGLISDYLNGGIRSVIDPVLAHAHKAYQNINRVKISHNFLTTDLINKFPNETIIFIDFDLIDDAEIVVDMSIKKWMIPKLNERVYNRIKGYDWPEYSKSLFESHPEIVDQIKNHKINFEIPKWKLSCDISLADHIIDFKTIFGINGVSLNETLATILGFPVRSEFNSIIEEYQQLNKRLYFK